MTPDERRTAVQRLRTLARGVGDTYTADMCTRALSGDSEAIEIVLHWMGETERLHV